MYLAKDIVYQSKWPFADSVWQHSGVKDKLVWILKQKTNTVAMKSFIWAFVFIKPHFISQTIQAERTWLRTEDGFVRERERRVRCNSCAQGRRIETNTQTFSRKVTELNVIHMLFLILNCTDLNEKPRPSLLVLRHTVQKKYPATDKKRKKELECFSFTPLLNAFFFLTVSHWMSGERGGKKPPAHLHAGTSKKCWGKTTARELLQLLIMEGICTK